MTDGHEPRERPELAELRARVKATMDEGRPDAVARRRRTGQRTARENVADLVDPESFVEYGGLALAGAAAAALDRQAREGEPRRRHRLRRRHRQPRALRR
jgi:acetyl-CoA carboxylase carboxyltransferase component